MSEIHRDPATGRPYIIDEQGVPRWADATPPAYEAPAPSQSFSQPIQQPAHARAAAAPAKRRGPLIPILSAAATGIIGLVVGIGIGGATAGSSGTSSSAKPVAAPSSTTSDAVEPAAETTSEASVSTSNYNVSLKTLSKQCFGSAGCSVEVRVELAVDPAARGADAEIIVSITGDESGPITETIEVEGDQYSPPEVSLSTPSEKTKVSVKIVSAEAL